MDYQSMAEQLRKPSGDSGMEVAKRMNERNQYMNHRTIGLLNIASGDRVLELGMANGIYCDQIASLPDAFYTGCDFSPLMVEEATKLNDHWINKNKASFFLAEAAALPFEDQAFDKIFTVNTLYFWKDPQHELRELRRIMKQDSTLIITIRSRATMIDLPFVSYGFRLYDESDLRNELTTAGFSEINIIQEEEPMLPGEGRPLYFQSIFAICRK